MTHRVGAASIASLLALLSLLLLPVVVQAQFTFTTNNGSINITGYAGPGGDVSIPSATNGLPVTTIGTNAFSYCAALTNITIPDSVTSIGEWEFSHCALTSIIIPNIAAPLLSVAGGGLILGAAVILFPKSMREIIIAGMLLMLASGGVGYVSLVSTNGSKAHWQELENPADKVYFQGFSVNTKLLLP